jgi:hypothetical protein
MTELASYAQLVTECQDWLFGRADIAAKVPTFVRLCEAKMNRNLRCRQMETRATATIDLGSTEPEFISLPGDFQMMRRVRLKDIAGYPRLGFATNAQIDDERDRTSTRMGQPELFNVAGDEMELFPTPVAAHQLEMTYRRNLPPLGAENTTNWLLDLAPDAYLYGALMEAAPYLHEDERIPIWASGVQGAVDQLNKLSEDATYNAGPLMARRVRRAY